MGWEGGTVEREQEAGRGVGGWAELSGCGAGRRLALEGCGAEGMLDCHEHEVEAVQWRRGEASEGLAEAQWRRGEGSVGLAVVQLRRVEGSEGL